MKIGESLKLNSKMYNIESICYFQRNHYSVHVKNAKMVNLPKNELMRWQFHDGLLNNGRLVEVEPKFNVKLNSEMNIPYILLYKQNE